MWKRKKKQKTNEEAEEIPSPKNEEEQVSVVTEEILSPKEEENDSEAIQETASSKEEQISAVTEETPSVEEVSPSGVFIFGKRIESRFKKFIMVLFSILFLPPVIVFGLLVITSVVLIAFPLISIALPITLLSLCILLIALPVVIPFLTVITLITGKGKVYFGLKNKKFAIKALGITFPPHAGRER